MVTVGRLPKKFFPFFIFFSFGLGISFASHLNGHLEVLFPGEISTVSLASVGTFCVARSNADPTSLKSGVDWACGPGLANCGPIQPGQPCYVANNIVAIASYAYDAYYQANQGKGGTCFFSNTAQLTNTDPSTGSCIFPGSAGAGTNPGGGTPPGGSGTPPGGSGTPPGGPGTPSGGSGTPPGGSGTPSGGSGTPGGPGTSPGSSGTVPGSFGTPPGNSSFAPFQPDDGSGGAPAIQKLNLVFLLPVVFLSLLIL